jgi:hypothetical protein
MVRSWYLTTNRLERLQLLGEDSVRILDYQHAIDHLSAADVAAMVSPRFSEFGRRHTPVDVQNIAGAFGRAVAAALLSQAGPS